MINDHKTYIILSFTMGFCVYYLFYVILKTALCGTSVNDYLKEEFKYPWHHRYFTKSQKFWLLMSHKATYWTAPIAQIHHYFLLSNGQSMETEKGFAFWLCFHDPLLWGLCFLKGNVSRSWHPQRSWTEPSWKGQEGSALESSGGIGRILPFRVPPFLLLALPWH